VKRKTPGGRSIVRYERRKPGKAKCSGCRKELPGTPKDRPHKVTKMAKTRKRPERMYGGTLCPRCARDRIKSIKVYKAGA
jgi:large subunit ribosomal protein L34e